MTLSNLPAVSFAPDDGASIERDILTTFERIQNVTLYPGDPERLFLEALAYWGILYCGLVDQAGRQNLLAFATGAHLDHLGAFMHTPRLEATAAECVLRFVVGEVLDFGVVIPAGTRAGTKDGGVYFATRATAEIKQGTVSVDVPAAATATGSLGNGLVAGQVNTLVDPVAYVVSVANTGMTMGGAETEEDEHYRGRIQLAPEAFSCAGSEGAYRYHVMAVHRDIADVAVWSPTPGQVDIRPIMAGGEMPSDALLEKIRNKVSAKTVRPLTDTVTVAAPEPVTFNVAGGWYLLKRDSALAGTITAAVDAAVEAYRKWQRSVPGRDINPDELRHLVKKAGAKRIVLEEPVFTALAKRQIAREGAISFRCLGVEDV